MLRDVVKINEDLCDGCGLCVPGCHEGALQVIDDKARLVSELLCDGLGACLGHCPQGAISVEKREAEPYDELKVMEIMVKKGKNTVIAHLNHLKDHNENEYLREGVRYLLDQEEKLDFSMEEVVDSIYGNDSKPSCGSFSQGDEGGCPGSKNVAINRSKANNNANGFAAVKASEMSSPSSELRQWPVQLHLVNPQASSFRKTNLLIAADCTAFTIGDFHQKYLKGKSLVIACPKLDSNTDVYIQKITQLVDIAEIDTITVMIMQVPCCGGLLHMVRTALSAAKRKVPVKMLLISLEGSVIREEWVTI